MTAELALVANGGSRIGLMTVEALTGRYAPLFVAVSEECDPAIRASLSVMPGVEILIADCATESGWEMLKHRLEPVAGDVDLIVHCPLPSLSQTAAENALIAGWLCAKHANSLMANRAGILVTQCLTAASGRARPELDAAANGLRISLQAALLDAMKAGVTLRSNRLLFPEHVDSADLAAAIAALTDDRTSFMSGAGFSLAAREPSASHGGTSLVGKSILITGATSGIGRATAIEIGRRGGWVAVGGRKQALAEETLDLLRQAGGDGMVVPLDVTNPRAWDAAIEAVLADRGALHGLVNNAGEAKNKPIAELALGDLSFLLDINYRGMRAGLDRAIDPIAASGGGSIVNIASVAGIRAGFGGSAYGGSKAAMIGLTQAYANAERFAANVRINAVQPGLIWSDSVADSMGEEAANRFRAMIEPKTPLGRVGQPEKVGRLVAFLLSDGAGAIDGQAITLSGGLELNFP